VSSKPTRGRAKNCKGGGTTGRRVSRTALGEHGVVLKKRVTALARQGDQKGLVRRGNGGPPTAFQANGTRRGCSQTYHARRGPALNGLGSRAQTSGLGGRDTQPPPGSSGQAAVQQKESPWVQGPESTAPQKDQPMSPSNGEDPPTNLGIREKSSRCGAGVKKLFFLYKNAVPQIVAARKTGPAWPFWGRFKLDLGQLRTTFVSPPRSGAQPWVICTNPVQKKGSPGGPPKFP